MPYKYCKRVVYHVGEEQVRGIFPVKTLREGECQDYQKLLAECKTSGKKFEDPEFNPDTEDLVGHLDIPEVYGWDGVYRFKRPKEAKSSPADLTFAKVDDKGKYFSYSDIQQGTVGDCWLLTAIGIITTSPELVAFVIPTDNTEGEEWGIYHFRFWHKGFFLDVVVDDRLPFLTIRREYGGEIPLLAGLKGGEMWPSMLEKAYAKLYRKIQNIDGGQTYEGLEDLTGGITEVVVLKEAPVKGGYWKPGVDVLLGVTPAFEQHGLVTGHAFAVVDGAVVNSNGKEVSLLKIRNPWGRRDGHGRGEWDGDWSDNSPLWDTIPPEDKLRLLSVKDDGEFWMTFEFAMSPQIMKSVGFCYLTDNLKLNPEDDANEVEEKYHWQSIQGTFKGPVRTTLDTYKETQYVVEVKKIEGAVETAESDKKPVSFIVNLMYKNYVGKKGDDIPQLDFDVHKLSDELAAKPPPYSAFEIQRQTHQSELLPVKKYRAREFTSGQNLEPGKYVIIPYCLEANPGDEFLLRIKTQSPIKILASSDQPAPPSATPGPQAPAAPTGYNTGYNAPGSFNDSNFYDQGYNYNTDWYPNIQQYPSVQITWGLY